jgi:hypothetical protein
MARLKKTTIYLTPREHAALRRAAFLTRRTQSDLIREAVRRVVFSTQLLGSPSDIDTRSPAPPADFEIRARVHTVQEGLVATLYQLKLSPAEIAADLGISRGELRQIFVRLGIPDEVRYG